jgi:hypothetical protein
MCKFSVGIAFLLLGVTEALSAQSAALPPSPVTDKVVTACTECHDTSIIAQQRLSKAAWTKEVDKMTKWGALVAASDREAVIEYLSVNFPPENAPEIMPRSAPAKR